MKVIQDRIAPPTKENPHQPPRKKNSFLSMSHFNIEIKASCSNPDEVRSLLISLGAVSHGTDYQKDTYFNVPTGKLKLREGNIENSLIFYLRPEESGPKRSEVFMETLSLNNGLAEVLSKALGVHCIVEKQREIYFIDNVKFHIDSVENLGHFIEIEAISAGHTLAQNHIQAQCEFYIQTLHIKPEHFLTQGYAELISGKDSLS
jgi:adenylate cyclase class 2